MLVQGQGALSALVVYLHDPVVGRGAPSRAQRVGSCLTLRKELSEETRADKASDFIGKGTPAESTRVREPRGPALACG